MTHYTADNLPRLMACNGSRLMEPSFPALETDQTVRNEGIAAHYMAKAVFDQMFTFDELIDRKAPNGVIITGEMAEHVGEYLSALDCGEMEVDTSWAGPHNEFSIGGRADHIVWREERAILVVDDLKYGWGIREPDNNWTLLSHAIGYCLQRNVRPVTVVLRIHQPRPYHQDGKCREWVISAVALWEYYSKIFATLSNPSDTLITGQAWCKGCHALATCPAARAASMNAVDATDIVFNDKFTDEQLAFELDTLRTAQATIENRVEALGELAKHRIKNGAVVPNYSIMQAYGNRTFKPGLNTPEILFVMTGVDCSKPGVCTPAQAGKRGVSDALIETITYRPDIGQRLIRVDPNKQATRLLNQGKK